MANKIYKTPEPTGYVRLSLHPLSRHIQGNAILFGNNGGPVSSDNKKTLIAGKIVNRIKQPDITDMIAAAWQDSSKQRNEDGSITLKVRLDESDAQTDVTIRFYQNSYNSKHPQLIRKDSIPKAEKWAINQLRNSRILDESSKASRHYLARSKAAKALNSFPESPFMEALWDAAKQAEKKGQFNDFTPESEQENWRIVSGTITKMGIVEFEGLRIPFAFAEPDQFLIHEDGITLLKTHIDPKHTLAGKQIPLLEIMKTLGLDRDRVIDSRLVQAFLPENETITPQDLPEAFQGIAMEYRTLKKEVNALHIPEKDLPLVAQYFHAILPDEQKNFLDKSALATKLGTTLHNKEFKQTWDALEKATQEAKDGEPVKLNDRTIDARRKQTGGVTRIYVNKAEKETFRNLMQEGIDTSASSSISSILGSISAAKSPRGGGRGR